MKIYFALQANRVYKMVKDGKVELLIANKDCTCFRTIEQLVELKGSVEVKAIRLGEMIKKLKELRKEYDRQYIKLGYGKIKHNKFIAKKMSQKEILIYESMEQERKEKVHEIIGDANKFFVKNGYYLFDDGTLIDKNNKIIDQEYMLEKDVRYFLPTGERVERSFTNIEYYNSVDELKSLRKSLQKEYDERLGRSEEKIKKNNEKYLEF